MKKHKTLIAPSILSADFGYLAKEAQEAERAGADWLHVDVMDGHFVPNLTIGPGIVKALRRAVSIPLDVHLMIERPGRYVGRFVDAGASFVTIHAEAVDNVRKHVRQIQRLGVKAGVSLKPRSGLWRVRDVLDIADMILIMSVNPGFGGQSFMPSVLPKISKLKQEWPDGLIEIDGGINAQTATQALKAGADVLVAGTAVFGQANRKKAIQALRK
jgi:ribulose-phosphate 3-epimerase